MSRGLVMRICMLRTFLGRMGPRGLMLSSIRRSMGIVVAGNARGNVDIGGVR